MKSLEKANLLMLIGALIDIAEGNHSPYAAPQIKNIEKRLEKIFDITGNLRINDGELIKKFKL